MPPSSTSASWRKGQTGHVASELAWSWISHFLEPWIFIFVTKRLKRVGNQALLLLNFKSQGLNHSGPGTLTSLSPPLPTFFGNDLFGRQSSRKTEGREAQVFHRLVHFLNECSGQDWARPQVGSQECLRSIPNGCRASSTWASRCCFQVHSRGAGLKWSHLNLTWGPTWAPLVPQHWLYPFPVLHI